MIKKKVENLKNVLNRIYRFVTRLCRDAKLIWKVSKFPYRASQFFGSFDKESNDWIAAQHNKIQREVAKKFPEKESD